MLHRGPKTEDNNKDAYDYQECLGLWFDSSCHTMFLNPFEIVLRLWSFDPLLERVEIVGLGAGSG
jgi:hypothetical protein